MTTKTVYCFDRKNFAFTGTQEAQPSPLEPGKFLEPEDSTVKPVPKFGANEIPVYSPAVDDWAIQPDFRGQTLFDQSTGDPVEIIDIGTPAANLGLTIPPAVALKLAIAEKVNLLSGDCSLAITSGFASSALGLPYTYPSALTDQSNLIGAVSASYDPTNSPSWAIKFWCMDANGFWDFHPHSASQIQKVLADGVAQREVYSAKLQGLVIQAQNVTAIADLAAITW